MKEFFERLQSSYACTPYQKGYLLRTPIMYEGSDHTFSFYVERLESGAFKITDNGQTMEYLRENLDVKPYAERIARLCEYFEIQLIDGVLVGRLASFQSGQTARNLEKFIGAAFTIAHIDALSF